METQLPVKGHNSLDFSTHFYCGQTGGWIKMLGTEVGLGQGHIELDGEPPVPPPSSSKGGGGTAALNFHLTSIVAKVWPV